MPSIPPMPNPTPQQSPSLLRRLAAMGYDSLLLIALWFVATALLLPFNAGQAFTHEQVFYPVYLLIVSGVFYSWFWTHGGQTLGLRTWKMQVLTTDKQPLSWRLALLRFSTALISLSCFGLGFLWIIFDKNQRAWHDRLSNTAVFFKLDPP